MKQYRCKVAFPGFEVGAVVDSTFMFSGKANGISYYRLPHHYPHLFEEVPDPVERVATYLAIKDQSPTALNIGYWKETAEKLIAAGLDVEKLEDMK